jgi:VanZ family protein
VLVVLGLMALIAFLSVIPGQSEKGDSVFVWAVAVTPPTLQKIAHVVLYAAVALLWMRVFEGGGLLAASLKAALITIAFGAAMEWAQAGIPGRFGNVADILLNAVGTFLGILAAVLFL